MYLYVGWNEWRGNYAGCKQWRENVRKDGLSGGVYLCRMEWVERISIQMDRVERNICAGWNEWRGISVQDEISGEEYLCRMK